MLAAMAEVCAERGASNVTVAHVVARSGVSRRTFYEHFVDREACFLATLEEALESAGRYVRRAYETPARWHERIRASLVALLSFLEDEPFMGRILVVDTLGSGPAGLERRRQVLAGVVAALDEGRLASKSGADLPPLTAEGVVGGVLSVIHTRLLEPGEKPLLELTGPLMSMIVLPYLGAAAAKGELARPAPVHSDRRERTPADPLRDVEMRLTYRTVRVLAAVGTNPGSSNREIGWASGMQDQGQISKLLTRLSKLGLIENTQAASARGAPNAWTLTAKGAEIERAVGKGAATD
jgi:AcrR family transcriptional regulator